MGRRKRCARNARASCVGWAKDVGSRRRVVEGAGPQRPAGPVGADDDARGRSLCADDFRTVCARLRQAR
jgi:hypothetical protein